MSVGYEQSTLEQPHEPAVAPAGPAVTAPACSPVAVRGRAVGLRRTATGADPLGGTTVTAEVGDALRRRRGRGHPLAPEHADRMGEAMGFDFGAVRIHDDGQADTLARSVQATAFTAGSDVYFRRGTYAPGTPGGDHLLAHELAHVVQGDGGRSSAEGPVIGAVDDPAEAAADAMAATAISRLRRRAAQVSGTPLHAVGAGPALLAPLRRQAARVETVRRMRTTTDEKLRTKALPSVWKRAVGKTREERAAVELAKTNARNRAEQEAEEQQLSGPATKQRIVEAEADVDAKYAGDPGPIANQARDQKVEKAYFSGSHVSVDSHWALMLGYGQKDALQWVKVDLIEAGYRLIWKAGPQDPLQEIGVQGTVGEVLKNADTVAQANLEYLNPITVTDEAIEQQGLHRYSCQHFVAKVAAIYGVKLSPVRK